MLNYESLIQNVLSLTVFYKKPIIKYLILDGIITQRLVDAAKTAGVENVIGHRTAKLSDSNGVSLKTFRELGIASN